MARSGKIRDLDKMRIYQGVLKLAEGPAGTAFALNLLRQI